MGGRKIDNARKKYKPENFKYEVLLEIKCKDKVELINILNEKEKEYIRKFNSVKFGYNIDAGGNSGSSLRTYNINHRAKISERVTNYYKTHTNVRSKPIIQFSIDGKFIKVWPSTRRAALELNLKEQGISCVLNKIRNQCGEFIWRYRDEYKNIPLIIDTNFSSSAVLPVYQYTLDGKFVKKWPSSAQAATELGYSKGNFNTYCNGRNNHKYKGFLYYKGPHDFNIINNYEVK